MPTFRLYSSYVSPWAFAGEGCDGVVMACTEIPLILGPADVNIPVLDSTRLLARAALNEALGHHPRIRRRVTLVIFGP